MKKLTRLSLCLLSSVFLLLACEKNNDPIIEPLPTENKFVFLESALADFYTINTIPISIDFKNDQVYIGDEDMEVHIFDTDLSYLGKVETQGGAPIYAYTLRHKQENGFFTYNQSLRYLMAFDENNHRYNELNELPDLENEFITAIDVDKYDNVFLIYNHNTLHKYSSDLGEPLAISASIGTLFQHEKYDYQIMSICVDNFDHVYISVDVFDTNGEGYDLILEFDNQLNYLRQLGGNRTFDGPHGIAFDAANNMYVVSRWHHVVKVFNSDFEQIAVSGPIDSPGQDDGELDEPIGIRINNNQVFITEKNNHRISIFSALN